MRTFQDTMKMLGDFAPGKGTTVIPAPGKGKGFWSGGSFATISDTGEVYLYYRLRKPRIESYEAHRGYQCGIARSSDGISFETIWSAGKKDFDARSIEKGCMVQRPDGKWLLYISYDSESTERWQIDVIEADRPDSFNPSSRKVFLTHTDVEAHDIKDPHVFLDKGSYTIFANNTTEVGPKEETLVVLSGDGITISEIHKEILAHSPDKNAWDAYGARLTGIVPLVDGYMMFYDGTPYGAVVCEESCGICFSENLLGPYQRITKDTPFHEGVRYIQGLWLEDSLLLYYEFTLPNGEHELRVSRL
jgi:hypothetical protein